QLSFQAFLISNQVIIDKENRFTPAEPVQVLQLTQDLVLALDAGHMSQKSGNVAKLAIEGTSTRILDDHRGIVPQIHQFPHGCGGLAEIAELPGSVDTLGCAVLKIMQEGG